MKPHSHYDQEEEYILILYAKEQCIQCTHILYSRYHNLIALYCRKKYTNLKSMTTDDLISQCYVYFLDAIRKFDIDTGNKFSTFLHTQLMQISRYVITSDNASMQLPTDYLQKLKRNEINLVTSPSLDTPVDEDSNGRSFEELLADEDAEDPNENILHQQLKQLIPMLTERQQYIIKEHYFKNKPITNIAKELGCKPYTAKTDLDHSLLMLRNSLLK